MHDDAFAPENKKIRRTNLNFLDKLTTDINKKRFIDHYCSLTGFPDLKKVAQMIEDTFLNAITKSSNDLKNSNSYQSSYFDIIKVGYDDTCSVGLQKAYPGSDIDKGYVIIKGSNNDELNEKLVNEFKGKLWENTDQRILSFNRGVSSVPIVYTLKQIIDMSKKIEKNMGQKNINKELITKAFTVYDTEFKTSAYYNEMVSETFPRGHYTNIKYLNPANPIKNDIKNFAFFIEILREGKTLFETDNNNYLSSMNYIKSTDFYKYSNLCQTNYIKLSLKPKIIRKIIKGFFKDTIIEIFQEPQNKGKSKLIRRQELATKFNTMPISDQYALIKSIIYASCDDKIDNSLIFENDFDMAVKLETIFNYMVTGNRNLLYIPKLASFADGEWSFTYGTQAHQRANLYLGNYGGDKTTLWIDTTDPVAIEQAINNIVLIKQIAKFKDITKIQAPCYTTEKETRNINQKSFYNKDIYEYKV